MSKKNTNKKQTAQKKEVRKQDLASGQSDLAENMEKVSERLNAENIDISDQPVRTISSMIGDIVWLMSQSQGHKYLTLADLEWMLMPPVVLEQYKIYRDDKQRPAGVALWAYLNEEAEIKLQAAGKISPVDWGNSAELSAEKGLEKKEGGTLWLIELIAPFSNEANKQKEKMLTDLISTNFKDTPFKMMRMNPETGKRESGWVNGRA